MQGLIDRMHQVASGKKSPLSHVRERMSATRGSREAEGPRRSWKPIFAPRSGLGGEVSPAGVETGRSFRTSIIVGILGSQVAVFQPTARLAGSTVAGGDRHPIQAPGREVVHKQLPETGWSRRVCEFDVRAASVAAQDCPRARLSNPACLSSRQFPVLAI
jgi:hypothetical protein